MSWELFIKLSGMMFLEFAVWGAWMPVLAARLLGPLKMSGKQTGWIYATLPLGFIISPLVAGQMADQWINTEWILVAAHAIGAVLLFVAARTEKFGALFVVMLLYSFCFAATVPLVNALMFTQLDKAGVAKDMMAVESGKIFIWAPISWALAGYFLTGWRSLRKGEGDGRDCLILAAVLSVVMAVWCVFLPHTAPAKTTEGLPIVQAFSMLADTNFLIFLVISLVVAGLMQFYFLGTAQFMQDMGIPSKNVPAAMAIAQVAQAVATMFALGALIAQLGYRWDLVRLVGYQWTLTIGALSWVVLYVVYVVMKPRWLVVVSQSLHGLAYVTFIIAGQIYADTIAPAQIRNSVQALVFAATMGIGLFLFTQFAGVVMDFFSLEGKFQWRKIWFVPGVIMLAGAIGLATSFDGAVGAQHVFNKIDADKDGKITKAEIEQLPEEGVTSGALAYKAADLIGWFGMTEEPDKSVAREDFPKNLGRLDLVVGIDADKDGNVTAAEIEEISEAGLVSGDFAYAKKDIVELFQKSDKTDDSLARYKLAKEFGEIEKPKPKPKED